MDLQVGTLRCDSVTTVDILLTGLSRRSSILLMATQNITTLTFIPGSTPVYSSSSAFSGVGQIFFLEDFSFLMVTHDQVDRMIG